MQALSRISGITNDDRDWYEFLELHDILLWKQEKNVVWAWCPFWSPPDESALLTQWTDGWILRIWRVKILEFIPWQTYELSNNESIVNDHAD